MNLHVFVCSTALIQLCFYQVFKHWFIVSYLNLYFYWLLFNFTYWDILLQEPLTIQLSIFYHLSRAEVQTSLSSATSSSSVGGTQGRSQASWEIRSLLRVPSLPQSLLLRTHAGGIAIGCLTQLLSCNFGGGAAFGIFLIIKMFPIINLGNYKFTKMDPLCFKDNRKKLCFFIYYSTTDNKPAAGWFTAAKYPDVTHLQPRIIIVVMQ